LRWRPKVNIDCVLRLSESATAFQEHERDRPACHGVERMSSELGQCKAAIGIEIL